MQTSQHDLYLLLQIDLKNSQFRFKNWSFHQFLTPLALVEKEIPTIQETSSYSRIIHTVVFHFTGGEGLSVNFRSFLLYHYGVINWIMSLNLMEVINEYKIEAYIGTYLIA